MLNERMSVNMYSLDDWIRLSSLKWIMLRSWVEMFFRKWIRMSESENLFKRKNLSKKYQIATFFDHMKSMSRRNFKNLFLNRDFVKSSTICWSLKTCCKFKISFCILFLTKCCWISMCLLRTCWLKFRANVCASWLSQ